MLDELFEDRPDLHDRIEKYKEEHKEGWLSSALLIFLKFFKIFCVSVERGRSNDRLPQHQSQVELPPPLKTKAEVCETRK